MTSCKLTPSDAVVKRDALVRGNNVENDGSHDVKTFNKSPEISGQIRINKQSQGGFACPFLSPNGGEGQKCGENVETVADVYALSVCQ